jgi:hypothetical protein
MRWVVALSLLLSACSADLRIGPANRAPFTVPPGDKVVEEPNGEVIVEPAASPIEMVITGLSQAQTVRTLTRQLAR